MSIAAAGTDAWHHSDASGLRLAAYNHIRSSQPAVGRHIGRVPGCRLCCSACQRHLHGHRARRLIQRQLITPSAVSLC